MILLFEAIDPQKQWRVFTCQLDGLEEVIELLDGLVSEGNTLLKVQISDQDGRLELPCDAFDADSMTGHIRELKREWETVLKPSAEPATPSVNDLLHRVRALQRAKTDNYYRTLDQIQCLLETNEATMREGTRKDHLATHYRALIDQYRRYLTRLEANRAVLL